MAASNGSSLRNNPAGTMRFAALNSRGLNKLRNSLDRIVERIALDRFTPGIANQLLNLISSHALTRRRTSAVNNSFLDDGSVEIIRAELQRDLSKRRCQRDPISLNVRKIIQHQPRYCD